MIAKLNMSRNLQQNLLKSDARASATLNTKIISGFDRHPSSSKVVLTSPSGFKSTSNRKKNTKLLEFQESGTLPELFIETNASTSLSNLFKTNSQTLKNRN